jgi:hypothetical protein
MRVDTSEETLKKKLAQMKQKIEEDAQISVSD